MFDLERFINQYVIHRDVSMFASDIDSHTDELYEKIEGKSVLVIGGAGSIGSSFIRAILPFKPSGLVIVDTNENGLAELTRLLRSSGAFVPTVYLTYPMDYSSMAFKRMFCNYKRADRSREIGGFDIVANFSAHKHVRSEKDIFSVEALLRNNVMNARILLDLLIQFPPEEYFCVSTDKAANPVNIMGASKRLMEDLIFSYSDAFNVKTARFANVAFSNGSLLDGFMQRLGHLQPLSAPSDIKRYFVSPNESGQICMLSAILGKNRAIFFPKLGESTMATFDAIAVDLLHEYGYEPLLCDSDEEAIKMAAGLKNGGKLYPVHFSRSDTSGEKKYEEFYVAGECIDLDCFKSLGVITGKSVPDKGKIIELINELEESFNSPTISKVDIVRTIASYLPNFEHIETGKSLDGKM